MWIWLAACDSGEVEPTTTTTTPDTGGCLDLPAPADPQDASSHPERRIDGSMSFHIDFDAAAEADGYVDCDFVRTMAGPETVETPWTCPACDVMYRTDTQVSEGADCAEQVSTAGLVHVEILGVSGDRVYRSQVEQDGLRDYCDGLCDTFSSTPSSLDFTWHGPPTLTPTGGAQFVLDVVGAFTITSGPDEISPLDGHRTEPYACGWPLRSPGGPSAWEVRKGHQFPNFHLEDQCGDGFDLWDLRGAWTVVVGDTADHVDPAAYERLQRQVDALNADCIPTELVVVLGDDQYYNGTPSDAEMADFVDANGLTGPVLADEGVTWVWLVEADDPEFLRAYVVDPEGTLDSIAHPGANGHPDFESKIRAAVAR